MKIREDICNDLVPNKGDLIIFTLPSGKTYKYSVKRSFLGIQESSETNRLILKEAFGSNENIERILSDCYGYPPRMAGGWPNYDSNDFMAVKKVLDAIKARGIQVSIVPSLEYRWHFEPPF